MSDPMRAWQRLLSGNERSPDTAPVAAVFRCADPGPPGELVFDQPWGSMLDISTWGHVIDTSVLGSLEYAVATLEIPLIVVLGHHDCAAMHAAMRAWEHSELPDGAARNAVEHALWSIVRRNAPAESIATVTAAHIVETGLALVQRSPIIAARVDAGRCGIVCASPVPGDNRVKVHATIGPVGEREENLAECV